MKFDLLKSRRSMHVVAFVAVLLVGCGPAKPTTTAPPPAQVTVVSVHRGSVPIATELPGRTSPHRVAQVRARVDGIVLSRDFEEGAEVAPGQRLFQIDPAPYIAQLNSATATLQKAQANVVAIAAQVERLKVLVGTNMVSQQQYDNAVAARGQALADVAAGKAAVDLAQINLGYTNVVSPIAGRSGVAQVTQGAYVQASAATLMVTVQQTDPIYVDLTQSSVEGLQLRADMASGRLKLEGPDQAKVALLLEDGTQYPLPGSLEFSDITVDQGTGSVTVRAIFPNPHSLLLPGMFVRARIDEGVDPNAMLVPEVGVTHDPAGHASALIVGADNIVEVRPLKLRSTVHNQWIVEDGLSDGDRVIVAGIQRVQPGASVQPTEAPAEFASEAAAAPRDIRATSAAKPPPTRSPTVTL
jgi:membrane fusion protein (multidrug efflux system)